MKVFDRVNIIDRFIGHDKVPGIIVKDLGDFLVVDTIIGGTWKVASKYVELASPPKALFVIKNNISDEAIREFKKQFNNCIAGSKTFKTPIIETDD